MRTISLLFGFLALSLAGCATVPPPRPMTLVYVTNQDTTVVSETIGQDTLVVRGPASARADVVREFTAKAGDCPTCPKKSGFWHGLSNVARDFNRVTRVSPEGHVSLDTHVRRDAAGNRIGPFSRTASIVFLNRNTRDEERSDVAVLNERDAQACFALNVRGPVGKIEIRRQYGNVLVTDRVRAPNFKFCIKNRYNQTAEEYVAWIFFEGDPSPYPVPFTVEHSGRRSQYHRSR